MAEEPANNTQIIEGKQHKLAVIADRLIIGTKAETSSSSIFNVNRSCNINPLPLPAW